METSTNVSELIEIQTQAEVEFTQTSQRVQQALEDGDADTAAIATVELKYHSKLLEVLKERLILLQANDS